MYRPASFNTDGVVVAKTQDAKSYNLSQWFNIIVFLFATSERRKKWRIIAASAIAERSRIVLII